MAVPSFDISRTIRKVTHIDSGLERFNRLSRTTKLVLTATLLTITAGCVSVAVSNGNREPSSAAAVTIYPSNTPKATSTSLPTPTTVLPTETPRPVVTIAATQVVSESIGGQDATDPKNLEVPTELKNVIESVNAAYKIEGQGYGASNKDKKTISVVDKKSTKTPYVINTSASQFLILASKGVNGKDILGSDSLIYNISSLSLTDTTIDISAMETYAKFLATVAPKPTAIVEGTNMTESEKAAYIDKIKIFLKESLPAGTTVQAFDLGTVTGTQIRMFSVVAADIKSPHPYASELFSTMSKSNQNIVFTAEENLKMLELARKYIPQTIPTYPNNEGLFVSIKATDYKFDPLKLLERFKLSDRTRYGNTSNNTGRFGTYKSSDGKILLSIATGSEVGAIINGNVSVLKPEGAIRMAVSGLDAFNSKTMAITEEDWGLIVKYTGKKME